MSAVFDQHHLDSELRATVGYCTEAVRLVLGCAGRLRHDDGDTQVHAVALYGTVIELFSGCVGLAQLAEPNGIPILLRSMYEAHIELENLLHEEGYVEHIIAANLDQTIKVMESGPLRQAFKEGRKAEYDEFVAKLADLRCRGKGPLKIWERCKRAGRLDEYESLYALFCMDTHSNSAALAERHASEREDGAVQISVFGPYDPWVVIRRLDIGLGWLLRSGRDIHGGLGVPAPELDELGARLDRMKAERQRRIGGAQAAH